MVETDTLVTFGVAAIVAAVTASLFWTRRRCCDVTITSTTNKLTAGVRTKLCTIHVQLVGGKHWDCKQESLPRVRKSFCRHAHLGDRTEISQWYIGDNGKPEKKIYVTLKKSTETNALTFELLEKPIRSVKCNGTYLNLNEERFQFTCSFSVLPSDPNDIKFKDILSDNEYWWTIYRGGTANILVETYDEFGNLSGSDQLLDKIKVSFIESSHQIRIQPRRIHFSDVGVCAIELDCLKVGIVEAIIEFDFGSDNTKMLKVPFHVHSPPLSTEHSRIMLEEQNTIHGMPAYNAGTDVNFTICIRDLYGNPLQKEDTLDNTEDDKVEVQVLIKNQKDEQVIIMPLLLDIRHASLTAQMNKISVEPTSEDDESDFENEQRMRNNSDDLSHKEAKSIVVRETEQTDIFEISFTPFKTGERELDVCLMDESISSMPRNITVLPASPKRIMRIRNVEYMDSHDHVIYDELENKDEVELKVVAQQNVWQFLQFTLVDTYGNMFPQGCNEDTRLEICLTDAHGKDLLETDGFTPCADAEESLQTKYKAKKQGKFQLHLLLKPKTSVAPTTPSTSVGSQTSVVDEKPESCNSIRLLHLEVVAAISVEDSKFDILDTFEDVDGIPTLFVDEVVKCKLDLRDERGCSYKGPFPIQNLDICLDGDKMKLGSVKESGGNYLFNLIFGKSGKKRLSVQLGGKDVTLECPRVFQIFGMEPYDIENCKLIYRRYFDDDSTCIEYITSQEVSEGEIIGPDHSRLNNINRMLSISGEELEDEYILGDDETSEVNMYIGHLTDDQATTVHWLVLSYLRGRHYRKKASEFDEQRQKWKTKSQEAWKRKNRRKAKDYSQIKTRFSSLMSKSNKMARDQIFGMYNKDRGLQEIDLHELLVADERKLEKLYQRERQRHGEELANEVSDLPKRFGLVTQETETQKYFGEVWPSGCMQF